MTEVEARSIIAALQPDRPIPVPFETALAIGCDSDRNTLTKIGPDQFKLQTTFRVYYSGHLSDPDTETEMLTEKDVLERLLPCALDHFTKYLA